LRDPGELRSPGRFEQKLKDLNLGLVLPQPMRCVAVSGARGAGDEAENPRRRSVRELAALSIEFFAAARAAVVRNRLRRVACKVLAERNQIAAWGPRGETGQLFLPPPVARWLRNRRSWAAGDFQVEKRLQLQTTADC
jgi:hypothetical protein